MGPKVIYTRNFKVIMQADRDYGNLWMVNIDGSPESSLDSKEINVTFSPVWSPDGTKVAYRIKSARR